MLRQFTRSLARSAILRQKNPLIHENGLYYGKFTKEEYEDAKAFVTSQYEKLEKDIKGSHNIRENVGKMAQFPAKGPLKKVNNLLDFFLEMIKTTGPISLSAFMRQCLTHPDYGYYTTRNPLDTSSGDFITSPEISSVFGEMIGIWLYTVWTSQGSPESINVIEFGPGRGTLMYDVMSVFTKFVKKLNIDVKCNIVMIEASPVLRKEQWGLLCSQLSAFEIDEAGFNVSKTKWGTQITWVDTEKDIISKPDDANYIIAHEFFDALPIKSFTHTEHGWRELLVEHSSSVVNTQGKLPSAESDNPQTPTPESLEVDFHLTASPKETPSSTVPTISERFRDLPVGTRIEVCADAELYMKKIMQLIGGGTRSSGGALIIDYGLADEIPLNSLRGIYKHQFVSPFYKPGDVDLSIDVDFENLKLIALPQVDVFGPVEQGDWLHELGIGYRFDQLIKSANLMANKELIYESYLRLTSKDDKGMGKIYKFMGLLPKGSAKPVGFGGSD
ncbi:CIC11C00000003585 [Sungouiella intermedia]|uniref:Protein arginine methyltransferase NDUFAF7 n=1 Tax=Sungouiella intermedia TaxID=45354 RepID=A0A1L0C474_9ASCO|nr:CIC11C00000003585 [[Candida] intermedia]